MSREERWYVILADAANNITLAHMSVSLLEAESIGVGLAQKERVEPKSEKNPPEAQQNGPSKGKSAKSERIPGALKNPILPLRISSP